MPLKILAIVLLVCSSWSLHDNIIKTTFSLPKCDQQLNSSPEPMSVFFAALGSCFYKSERKETPQTQEEVGYVKAVLNWMKNSLNPVSAFQSQHSCFRRIRVRIQAAGILEDEGSPVGVLVVVLVLAGATLFLVIWKRDLYQAVVSRLTLKLKSSPNTSTSRPGPQDGDFIEQLVDIWKQVEHIEKIFQRQYRVGAQKKKKKKERLMKHVSSSSSPSSS